MWESGQDQAAVVKRRLVELLPGISIFLDVDDLKEIGDLELYVQQAGCVLIFLSNHYFYSVNCMREAQTVTDQRKPVVLLREEDPKKGGITLASSMQECVGRPKVRQYIFHERTVTAWKRVNEYQLESLRQVAISVLVTTPQYHGRTSDALGLHLPGEVRLQRLALPTPLTLYCSRANHGALRAARELSTRLLLGNRLSARDLLGSSSPRPLEESSSPKPLAVIEEMSNRLLGGNLRITEEGASLKGKMMLLYLNQKTWEKADDGSDSALAAEVAKAREEGVPLLLVHEADEDRDGCEFALFFQTTCAVSDLKLAPPTRATARLRTLVAGHKIFSMTVSTSNWP